MALLIVGGMLSFFGLILADFGRQERDMRIFLYIMPGVAAIIMAGIAACFE